jgi:soluble lytic murein transglycosylase
MSAHRSHARRARDGRGAYASRRRARGASGLGSAGRARRVTRGLAALALSVVLAVVVAARVQRLPSGNGLPLRDASVIREQAAEKHLDPTLIAAVIYAETKFDPRTSPAGALGLMQLEPATARYIAHLSGGVRFTTGDLATPRINVAYGSWYLRYLLDHYEGNELDAVAAYNGGLANVDAWVAKARAEGGTLTAADIPFPETRAYVERVLRVQGEYRATYPRQLGLT